MRPCIIRRYLNTPIPCTRHQMVWVGSERLGCGVAPSCSLWVCHYDPPGNVVGRFPANVLAP